TGRSPVRRDPWPHPCRSAGRCEVTWRLRRPRYAARPRSVTVSRLKTGCAGLDGETGESLGFPASGDRREVMQGRLPPVPGDDRHPDVPRTVGPHWIKSVADGQGPARAHGRSDGPPESMEGRRTTPCAMRTHSCNTFLALGSSGPFFPTRC